MNSDSELTKPEIIDSFHKITCTATTTASDKNVQNNDYFKRRILGYKAEIEFELEINNSFEGLEFLEGGQFYSKPLAGEANQTNEFIYTTFDYGDPIRYLEVFKRIASWPDVTDLIYIQILENGWENEDFQIKEKQGGSLVESIILKPKFIFHYFDRGQQIFSIDPNLGFANILNSFDLPVKGINRFHLRSREQFNYLEQYELTTLKKIYATRYFMEHKKRERVRVNMLDLDGFLINGDLLSLIEIKEKSPIKTANKKPLLFENDWSYGWDSRRLMWYQYLKGQLGIETFYVVRQIDDRHERNFVQWDVIGLEDFLSSTTWSYSTTGGAGSDTQTCPYLRFKRLSEIFN